MITVVDTPGMYDTRMSHATTMEEVSKCVGLSAPGPHAFLLVISGIGRFTQEEMKSVSKIASKFGDDVFKYTVVVFTRKDALEMEGKTQEEFLKDAPSSLMDILIKCDFRYVWINNRAEGEEKETQVRYVLNTVDELCRKNGERYYTNAAFREADKILMQREAEIAEEMKLQNAYEMDRERLEAEYRRTENESKIADLERKLRDAEQILATAKEESYSANMRGRGRQGASPRFGDDRSRRWDTGTGRRGLSPRMQSTVDDEINSIRQEIVDLKEHTQEMLEEKEREIDWKFQKLERGFKTPYHSPRDAARREVQDGKSKMFKMLLRGLVAVGKHLLIGLAGLIFV